jgi:hypothetical protein
MDGSCATRANKAALSDMTTITPAALADAIVKVHIYYLPLFSFFLKKFLCNFSFVIACLPKQCFKKMTKPPIMSCFIMVCLRYLKQIKPNLKLRSFLSGTTGMFASLPTCPEGS